MDREDGIGDPLAPEEMTAIEGEEPVALAREALRRDRIGRLAAYWYDLAQAARGIPLRATFDPAAVVEMLPRLIVVEHLGNHDFRYRLLGTEVDRFAKARYTGRRTSEIPGHGPGNRIHSLYAAALGSDRPVAMTLPYTGHSAICRSVRQVAVPFRNGTRPDQVISLVDFELREELEPMLIPAAQRRLF